MHSKRLLSSWSIYETCFDSYDSEFIEDNLFPDDSYFKCGSFEIFEGL